MPDRLRKLLVVIRHPFQSWIIWRWTRGRDLHFVGLVNGVPQIQITEKVRESDHE